MEAEDQWRDIVREAIGGATQPVIGTHFRSAVRAAAIKRGLAFPPDTEPGLRLNQLIQRFPDVVTLMRRPGQDLLVVPAGRSDLLTVQSRSFGIRRDLFEAFTIASNNRPYYDKLNDKVIWRKPDTVDELPASCVPIIPTTLDNETDLRRQFIASLADRPSASSELSNSLKTESRLQSFGKAVRDVKVQREWHSFRTERIVERIQSWAKNNGIAWKDAWLTAERGGRAQRQDVEFETPPMAYSLARPILL